MMAMRFLWDNLADAATLTASSENADFPVSNLVDRRFKEHHRTTGVDSEWWKWDLGSAQNIEAFVFWYHNFQEGATINLQAHATDEWGDPLLNVSLDWNENFLIKYFSPAETYRWWRLVVLDVGNADGYLRGGRHFLGSYFEPSRNFVKDWSRPIVDPSGVEYSDDGQAFSDEKDSYLSFNLRFPGIITPDDLTFEDIGKHIGKGKRAFFMTLDPTDPEGSTYYVHSLSDWVIGHVYAKRMYSLELSLREEL